VERGQIYQPSANWREVWYPRLTQSVIDIFIKNDSLKEGHAAELVKLSNFDIFGSWRTLEDLMLKVPRFDQDRDRDRPMRGVVGRSILDHACTVADLAQRIVCWPT
jgi:hypothetical protein